MRKYKLKEDFFKEIDTEEKAYILGFLFADGSVGKNQISITLKADDIEVLNNIKNNIYLCDRPIKTYRGYKRLVISSKKMVNDLISLGCVPRKTFKLKFPKLKKSLVKHFIRGYFDGDGSVYISENTLNMSIVGTINFLTTCQKILIKKCNLNETEFDNRHPERKNNIRSLRYGGNIIMNRFYHYIYDDSTIFLTRKKQIFLDILEKKEYFCNLTFTRKSYIKYIKYNNHKYTKTELGRILSKLTNRSPDTIRKQLTKGWSVNDILSTPKNKHKNKNYD